MRSAFLQFGGGKEKKKESRRKEISKHHTLPPANIAPKMEIGFVLIWCWLCLLLSGWWLCIHFVVQKLNLFFPWFSEKIFLWIHEDRRFKTTVSFRSKKNVENPGNFANKRSLLPRFEKMDKIQPDIDFSYQTVQKTFSTSNVLYVYSKYIWFNENLI